MSPRIVLVHVDGRACGAETLNVATRVAKTFGSHLAAVFASPPPLLVAAMDPAAVVPERQAEAEQVLESMARAQVAAAETSSGLAIEWRVSTSNTIGNLALHARHADLLVMSQDDPGLSLVSSRPVAAGVIMSAGRPVLVVPHAGTFQACGESVLIAWNAGRESARAVADALPFLESARAVNVISFNPVSDSDCGEIPGTDVGLWLARHDIRVTVHERRSGNADVGSRLLSLAADLGADLVVMGAYGHSRAYQMVLGGVTRTILRSMTVPVMMSH